MQVLHNMPELLTVYKFIQFQFSQLSKCADTLQALSNMPGFLKCNESNLASKLNSSQPLNVIPNAKL